jgi:hypothetical protein
VLERRKISFIYIVGNYTRAKLNHRENLYTRVISKTLHINQLIVAILTLNTAAGIISIISISLSDIDYGRDSFPEKIVVKNTHI